MQKAHTPDADHLRPHDKMKTMTAAVQVVVMAYIWEHASHPAILFYHWINTRRRAHNSALRHAAVHLCSYSFCFSSAAHKTVGSVGSHQGPPVSLAQRLSKGSLRGFQGVPSNRGKHLLSHFNRMCEYGHVFPLYSFSSGAPITTTALSLIFVIHLKGTVHPKINTFFSSFGLKCCLSI